MTDTNKKLNDYINIDPASTVPLYKQLEDQLRLYIAACEQGEKLPSERTFAADLGLNRDTVRRGIKPYIDNGILKKYGRKGIIVEKEISDDEAGAEHDAHPLLFMENELLNKSSLKLFLYETLPHQKKFWEDVVELYNSSSPLNSIEIEWASRNLHNVKLYAQYIKDNKVDMYLSSVPEWDFLDKLDIKLDLPKKIKKLLAHEKYLSESLHKTCPERHNFGIPLHCSMWLLAVSEESVIDTFEQTNDPIKNIKNILEYRKDIEGNKFLINNLNNCICSYGFPAKIDKKAMEEYLHELYSTLFNLNSLGKNIYKNNSCWWDRSNISSNSASSENLFNFTFTASLHKISERNVRFKIYLPQSAPRNRIHSSISYLLVNKQTHDKDGCWEFAEFMLSDPVQKMVAEYKINLPLNRNFAKNLFSPEQFSIDLSKGFDNFKVNKESGIISDYLNRPHREEFDMLLNGQYPADTLVQDTMNILMRKR